MRSQAFALSLVLAACLAPQTPGIRPNPSSLPPRERLLPQKALEATLHLSADRITVDEPLRFRLRLRNTGNERLHLSPRVASNLRIFDSGGQLVPTRFGGIVDYGLIQIAPEEFIALAPAQSRDFDVHAEYHPSPDFSHVRMYTERDAAGLPLRPGTYSARFSYINYPDYGAARYDIDAAPAGIWEGRVETPPVAFTVLPSTQPSTSIDVLLDRFVQSKSDRLSIMNAVREAGGDAMARLFTIIEGLPERERDEVIMTPMFAALAREAPGCAGVPLLMSALYSVRGDVVPILGDAVVSLPKACPEVTDRLRSMVTATATRADDYGRTVYRRGHAAELLGLIGSQADAPLLIAVVQRGVAPIPSPSPGSDPARRGAVRALAQLGGTEAATALLRALEDDKGNRAIVADLVEAAAKLRPPGLSQALARLLTSPGSPPMLVIRTLIHVSQLRDASLIPQLRTLLKHPNATIRNYTASALKSIDDASAIADMRAAADDVDANVQTNALFYLANHGDATLLPLFVDRITSQHQYVREAASEGIARLGTAETFPPLRKALDTSSTTAKPYVQRALERLTFVTRDYRAGPEQWDAWWGPHARLTRIDWAREALNASLGSATRSFTAAPSPFPAMQYLAALRTPPRDLVERAAQHPNWPIRIAAAEITWRTDRRRAVAALTSELGSRFVSACYAGAKKLTDLTRISDDVDCTDPAARRQAINRWTNRLEALQR